MRRPARFLPAGVPLALVPVSETATAGDMPRPHARADAFAGPGTNRLQLQLGADPLVDLRHTGLSWMIRKKGITKAALDFAGHSAPAMMAKIYGHALPLQLSEVVDDLESIENEPEAPVDLNRALPVEGPGPALSYPDAEPGFPTATPVAEDASGRGSRAGGESQVAPRAARGAPAPPVRSCR